MDYVLLGDWQGTPLYVPRAWVEPDIPNSTPNLQATTLDSSQTHLLDLPQELLDTIVDLLHNDHRALCALALTSRAFLPRTRSHLHRAVFLSCSTFHDYYWEHLEDTYQNTALQRCVRDVTVDIALGGRLCADAAVALCKILRYFPYTTSLCFRRVSASPYARETLFDEDEDGTRPVRWVFGAIRKRLKRVKHVLVESVTFARPEDAASLLVSLPQLETLQMTVSGFSTLR